MDGTSCSENNRVPHTALNSSGGSESILVFVTFVLFLFTSGTPALHFDNFHLICRQKSFTMAVSRYP